MARVHPISGIMHAMTGLASDVVELAELQVRMTAADARTAGRRMLVPLVVMSVGVAGLLACLPVMALGLASLVAQSMGWPVWVGQLVTGASMLAVAMVSIALAWWRIRSAFGELSGSTQELVHNVAWLKRLLRRYEPSQAHAMNYSPSEHYSTSERYREHACAKQNQN